MDNFRALAKELGLPLAEEKTEGPAMTLTFLGIELDSVHQTSRLPQGKLEDLKNRVAGLIDKKKVTLRELQEIVGHLNFACRVVAPGRAFLQRLSTAMKRLWQPFHRTRVTAAIREDLEVWKPMGEQPGP